MPLQCQCFLMLQEILLFPLILFRIGSVPQVSAVHSMDTSFMISKSDKLYPREFSSPEVFFPLSDWSDNIVLYMQFIMVKEILLFPLSFKQSAISFYFQFSLS